MTATLRDVARRAGVSIRTVSNVVNGYARVAPATRERVTVAIDDLNYRPNLLAKSLKQGRSSMIALVLPELDTPYFAELTRAFVERAGVVGYTVVVDQTNGDVQHQKAILSRVQNNAMFDGVVLSPLGLSSHDLEGLDPQRPMVLLGEEPHTRFDHVLIDNCAAAEAVTQHLLAQGRKRPAMIGAPFTTAGHPAYATSTLRYDGYTAALEAAGHVVDPSLVVPVDRFSRRAGFEAMSTLLDRDAPPDAVFCASDVLAIGALAAAVDRGVRVPGELAMAGFDDTEEGRFSLIPLTSVSPDKGWIAETALSLLFDRLKDPDISPRLVLGPWRVAVRASTVGDLALRPTS